MSSGWWKPESSLTAVNSLQKITNENEDFDDRLWDIIILNKLYEKIWAQGLQLEDSTNDQVLKAATWYDTAAQRTNKLLAEEIVNLNTWEEDTLRIDRIVSSKTKGPVYQILRGDPRCGRFGGHLIPCSKNVER